MVNPKHNANGKKKKDAKGHTAQKMHKTHKRCDGQWAF